MNIFTTSLDPIESARALDNKRVGKMIVESAQLLCASLHLHGCRESFLYKRTHYNHPCTLWAGRTQDNFEWLCQHGLELGNIFLQYRNKPHKSTEIVRLCLFNKHYIPTGPLTEFADCTEFKHRYDLPVTERYRLFMNLKWSERDRTHPKWWSGEPPIWADIKRNDKL